MNVKVLALVFCVLLICLSTASVTTYSSHFQTYYEVEFYHYSRCSSYACGYSCYWWWWGWSWWWWWWYYGGCYYRNTCYTCYTDRASRTVQRQRCDEYWTGPNCNIPYCSPACTGGNTCTSENNARPTCKCLTDGQSKCKAVQCTSPSKSCYPGTCANQRCICPPEFSGDNCQTMLKTPEISSCAVKLFSGSPEAEVASANCAVEGHEAEITWVSKNTFSRIEPSYETDYLYPYEPVLATETVHIKDARFGVDFTKATVVLIRPTGSPIVKDLPYCKAAGQRPEHHVDCARRSILYTEFGQNSLPTNTTINITISSRLGGYKTVKPDTKEPIGAQNVSERRAAFKVDAMPPAHCRQLGKCEDPPISVKEGAVKTAVVDFNFTNWFDHESGIKSYEIEIYELLKSTSGRDPVLERAQKSKDKLTSNGNINKMRYTFPAPGVYSVELTVYDYANNPSKARKIMFYDNENHMAIKEEQLFVVDQASKESGYRWITEAHLIRNDNGVSRLSLSWKGRYSNSKHVQEGWLSRVPQWTSTKDIDDDLTDGKGGTRTIHKIDNANGTAFYKLAFKVDKQGGFGLTTTGFEEGGNLTTKDELPQSTWMSVASDVSSKEIVMPTLTGSDTVVIWMRAYDAVGYHVEDKILVRFDTSEPVLDVNSPAVLQQNTPDQYKSSIVIKATDMESGIAEVRYYIRDASLSVNITSGNVKARMLKKSGARKRRRRSAVCNPISDTTCYCINGGECFLKEIVVEIDHCTIDKHYADDKTMQFHYVVVNQAGKTVSPREPLRLTFTGGKPNCRPVVVFTAGTILAIAIGLLILMVLVVLVVFMILRWRQDKHPIPDRVRTFATSVRQKITNTEKVLDSEGHVIYRSKTRRGRVTEDDDDIYVDGSDPGGWRVNRDQVEVAETLAEGRFAVVKKAYLKKGGKTTTVAMKYLPTGASESDRSLLKAKIAFHGNKVPPHDNIVRLIGVLDEGPVMLLEFCDMTLKDWLSKVNKVDTDALENMLNFTMHIASGMEHLHSKSIVHRRLAMRNVLLKNDGMNGLVAKLIGFGSFNDVGSDDGAAEATANVAVPLKWLAPETLESVGRGKAVYTQKSDVWAYGVTIWEIYSLGATPYSGKKSAEVEGLLKTGYRMPKPDECPPELFDGVVVPCWNATAKKRPDFRNILKQIREFRSGGGDTQEGYYAVEGKSKTYDNPKERTTDYVSGRRAKENPYGAKDELYDDARR